MYENYRAGLRRCEESNNRALARLGAMAPLIMAVILLLALILNHA